MAVASSARYILAQVFEFVNPFFEIFLRFFDKSVWISRQRLINQWFLGTRIFEKHVGTIRNCPKEAQKNAAKEQRKNIKKLSTFFKKELDICRAIAYNNFRTKRNGELCNGSTYDSDSYCLGSNPSSPAKAPWSSG